METTKVYWGCIRENGKKMETTIVYWGYIRGTGKEHGNYDILF